LAHIHLQNGRESGP